MQLSKKADTHLILTNSEDEWFQEQGWQATRVKIRNPIKTPIVSKVMKLDLYDVCYLSRFHLRKRPKMLIEAIQILTAYGYNLRIRMAGSDEGELTPCNSMINMYSLRDNFDISGQISSDEISTVLHSSKVMVLPSYSEFVPMIILESLSHGVPVIAGSDCELAQELNENGICLLADQPLELANRIAALLEDDLLRKNLAMSGVAWVNENCNPIGVANKLLAVYSKSEFTY
jgi:glycosyltransferase involved in cell wall biosynthesis